MEDRERAFAHLEAMLRPGGSLLVTCPTGRVFPTERHFGHTTHPDETELGALAERAGLRLVSVVNWGFPVYRLTKWLTNLNPELALRKFAVSRYGPSQIAVSGALYLANFLNLPSSAHGCQLFAVLEKPA
jgi:hypothetical protein